MKKTNHFYRFCALALSCLLLISLLPVTQVLADGDGAIHIKSAEDLRSLAHSCTLDSWSRGKTVVLDNDIELTDDDELPIPTFGGTFNGNGHTISGLSITQSVSPAGLFGVLQKDAVIKNLNVEGTVTPSGDSENIGGIVGENYIGTVAACYWENNLSSGTGSNNGRDDTHKVEGTDVTWQTAVAAMNTALQSAGSGWHYVLNGALPTLEEK